jgi:hypothetical protein
MKKGEIIANLELELTTLGDINIKEVSNNIARSCYIMH